MENLEDLLEIDTEKNKAEDNKKLLRKLKQMLKKQDKDEVKLEDKASNMPYEAVSVVGNQFVTIKFDIESKEAIVSDIEVDSRDSNHRNYMAVYKANRKLLKLGKDQKQ